MLRPFGRSIGSARAVSPFYWDLEPQDCETIAAESLKLDATGVFREPRGLGEGMERLSWHSRVLDSIKNGFFIMTWASNHIFEIKSMTAQAYQTPDSGVCVCVCILKYLKVLGEYI
eukprot:4280511-Amphidinium_carterae.1